MHLIGGNMLSLMLQTGTNQSGSDMSITNFQTNMQQNKQPTWIQLQDLTGLLSCPSVSRISHLLLEIQVVSYRLIWGTSS